MKLSEKITKLRKANGMTQEELAAICSVSRQSISKWEADIALPETEKLLLLGDVFRVSMDILLKDELTLNEAKDIHSCGSNAIQAKKRQLYEGILIKESIADDSILDCMNIHKMELWNAGGKPKYWTALFFTSDSKDFPKQMAKVMRSASDAGAIEVLPKCMNDLLKCGILEKNIDVYDLHAGMEFEKLRQYDVVYLCGGSTDYLLERINATGFAMSLMAYINNNGMVIGVSAGSLIFSNNLDDNLGLIDTKLDVHCMTGEKRGGLAYPLKSNIKLTNTSALVIRNFPDDVEVIGE